MGLTVNVSKEKLLSSELIQDYIESVKETIKASFPEIDDNELQKVIEEELTNTVTTIPVISFENNYTKTKKKTDVLSWYSWFKKKKPITTEHGVVYKRHDESVNLSAKLLEFILDTRKYHKKKMLECKNNGDKIGEAFHNIRQKVYKIFANSYYGAMGEMRAIFYNLFTALSITGKGQSLITNAAMSFEMFFADNLQFKSMDDVYIYIRNIKNEKRNFKDSVCLKRQVSSEKLKKRLKDLFGRDYKNRIDEEILDSIIDKLSKKDINRIYYKNNLYEFCKNDTILEKIYLIMDKVDSFKNPNEVPKEIEEDLKELWSWMKEFVYYDHTIFDHTNIVKEMKRKTVVVVDTDSNMINTEPWIDFLLEHDTNHKYSKTNKEDVYKMVNIIAYILGNMIGSVHARYTEECNVPEDKRPIINMKNEFLMKRIMTTSNKKNYADYLWLQEGVEVPDEDSLDIKGLSIKKANVNNTVSKLLQENLENNILRSDDVNINTVLSSLIDLEKDIRTSLANGEVKYLVPDKSNEPSTYKTPFQVQAVRGIYVWNYLYPEKEITYPAQINKVKLNIDTIFKLDLDKMREDVGVEEADRIYNILEEKVFNDENMSKYGVTILCLPKSEKNIPKWTIPYIDVDTIVSDSLSNFNKILESIGVKTISFTADDAHYSNIIDF